MGGGVSAVSGLLMMPAPRRAHFGPVVNASAMLQGFRGGHPCRAGADCTGHDRLHLAVGFWENPDDLRANWQDDKRWTPELVRRRARGRLCGLAESGAAHPGLRRRRLASQEVEGVPNWKARQHMPVAPVDGVRLTQRVECGLLGCFRNGVEDDVERRPLRPELALHKDFDRQDAVWRHTGNAVGPGVRLGATRVGGVDLNKPRMRTRCAPPWRRRPTGSPSPSSPPRCTP